MLYLKLVPSLPVEEPACIQKCGSYDIGKQQSLSLLFWRLSLVGIAIPSQGRLQGRVTAMLTCPFVHFFPFQKGKVNCSITFWLKIDSSAGAALGCILRTNRRCHSQKCYPADLQKAWLFKLINPCRTGRQISAHSKVQALICLRMVVC